MYPNKREIKDVDLCCWWSKKNFGGAGGGEAIIKTECNKKNLSSIKRFRVTEISVIEKIAISFGKKETNWLGIRKRGSY